MTFINQPGRDKRLRQSVKRQVERLTSKRTGIDAVKAMSFKLKSPTSVGGGAGGGGGTGGGGSLGAVYYQTVQDNGSDMAQEYKINFIPGTNIILTITDNPVDSSTDVGIAAASGLSISGTDNHLVRMDGTTAIQDGPWILDDAGSLYCFNNTAILGIGSTGDTGARWFVDNNGHLWFGTGAGTYDVELSRAAANRLQLASGDVLTIVGQAGDHSDTTQGNVSYNTTTDKFRFNENGTWVYPDNLNPRLVVGDALAVVTVTTRWVIFGTALTAARNANLPSLANVPDGTQITITDDGAQNGANIINLNPNGTDKIQGVNAAYPLGAPLTSLTVAKGGSGWLII